jgi:hypothetical protein
VVCLKNNSNVPPLDARPCEFENIFCLCIGNIESGAWSIYFNKWTTTGVVRRAISSRFLRILLEQNGGGWWSSRCPSTKAARFVLTDGGSSCSADVIFVTEACNLTVQRKQDYLFDSLFVTYVIRIFLFLCCPCCSVSNVPAKGICRKFKVGR